MASSSPMLRILSTLLSFLSAASAFIPTACVHNVTKPPHFCCPTPASSSMPCGYPTRGQCRQVSAYKPPRQVPGHELTYAYDIRIEWPSRVFKHTCHCVENFWGPDCASCKLGFEGPSCQHRVRYIRRNIMSYSKLERDKYLQVLNASRHIKSNYVKPIRLAFGHMKSYKPMSVHETLVYIHFFASGYSSAVGSDGLWNTRMCNSVDMNHDGTSFILWHRLLLLWWERELRQIAGQMFGWKNFTVPYWDYVDSDSCEVCTSGFLCRVSERKDGKLSHCPIANWISFCKYAECTNCENKQTKVLTRKMNKRVVKNRRRIGKTLFPTSMEILNVLRSSKYYGIPCEGTSFSKMIEHGLSRGAEMHELVHNMFSGDMLTTESSPNDPIFLFHHSQLDRLLERWIRTVLPPVSQIPLVDPKKPNNCRHCQLVGFIPSLTSADLLTDLRYLGADYDNFSFGSISDKAKISPIQNSTEFSRLVCGRSKAKKSLNQEITERDVLEDEEDEEEEREEDEDDDGEDMEIRLERI